MMISLEAGEAWAQFHRLERRLVGGREGRTNVKGQRCGRLGRRPGGKSAEVAPEIKLSGWSISTTPQSMLKERSTNGSSCSRNSFHSSSQKLNLQNEDEHHPVQESFQPLVATAHWSIVTPCTMTGPSMPLPPVCLARPFRAAQTADGRFHARSTPARRLLSGEVHGLHLLL